MGFHLPSGGQLVAQALDNDSFKLLEALKENLERSMQTWNQPVLVSRLHIN